MVGTAAGRSLLRPSSRSARAGFGPRVILRTPLQRGEERRAQRRLVPLDAAQQPAQTLAGQQDQIIAAAGGRSAASMPAPAPDPAHR